MAILKCLACGKNLTPGAAFCPHCGAAAGSRKSARSAQPEVESGVTRRNINISLTLDTYKWLDDRTLRRDFAQRGIRSRSAVIQHALDEYFANHVCMTGDGELHDKSTIVEGSLSSFSHADEGGSSVWDEDNY